MIRPADYSDSDDYDDDYGFEHHYEPREVRRNHVVEQAAPPVQEVVDYGEILYRSVIDGNLDSMKVVFTDNPRWDVDKYLFDGYTLLLHACFEAHVDIVEYLLKTKGADCNRQGKSHTPLMRACDSNKDPEQVLPIVRMLLDHGAFINVLDNLGVTPLMYAAARGHIEIVKIFLDQASLEATDNEGLTALFYAVKYNHIEIVKLLLNAGACFELFNTTGRTPLQEAKFNGFTEIEALFPEKEYYWIPMKYNQYSDYKDIVQGEKEKDFPEFCQEIGILLFGMNSEGYLNLFAKNNIDLEQFLTISNERLEEIGIDLPFERKRILFGLLKLHRAEWKLKSLRKFSRNEKVDLYLYLETIANNLKHLIVLKSSLAYLKQNNELKPLSLLDREIEINLRAVTGAKEAIKKLRVEIDKVHKKSAIKPVLHVEKWVEKDSKPVNMFQRILSFMIGISAISLFIYFKTN